MPREERHLKAKIKAKGAAKAFIYSYLETHFCVDCGQANPIVLTFDHINGDKSANVSDMVNHGYSLEVIKGEIDKCEVVCANCHSRREQKRRGLYRWRRANGG